MTRTNMMRMMALSGLIVVGALGTAEARSEDRRPAFQEIDTDGDGQLSRAELEAHAAARFARADSNGDGFLSGDEIGKGHGGKRAQKMLERLDRDGDGKLDAAELEAAGAERRQERHARMLERLDSDGDGRLSLAEISARRDMGEVFDRLDTDNSGGLSAEEFARMRGHRKGKRGE